jgi:glycine hydroxymethyltransferase
MIFYRLGERSVDKKGNKVMYDLKTRIDNAVFPGHQGGPHDHTIAGLSVALHLAKQPHFKEYQSQVLKNCQSLVKSLTAKNYQLVSGGSDNHLVLVDLGSKQLDGARAETILDLVNIVVNKNTVPGDRSAIVPRGLRLGTPAMTSRGLVEADFEQIVQFIDRGIQVASSIKEKTGTKLADFKKFVQENHAQIPEIAKLKKEVHEFCQKFPVPQ